MNLEMELYRNVNLCERAKKDLPFAQNLYAAMCNMAWKKDEVISYTSWRSAGSIVATMREEGDYMDWYCSGMIPDADDNVEEGTVTREIEEILNEMGWVKHPSGLKIEEIE